MQITKREFLKKLGLLTAAGAASADLKAALVKAGCYLG